MSTTMKDRMVEGTDTQQMILKYNYENKMVDNVRTPKRHHSDEIRPTINDEQIILSGDDETEFQVVNHRHKRFQHDNKGNDYHTQNDVMKEKDDVNNLQQQYIQKKRITTMSRTFVNGEMATMNHHLKKIEMKKNDKQIDNTNYLNHQENEVHQNNDRRQKQQNQFNSLPELLITNHALHYAVEQHLPPINIKCEPKLVDQKHATMLIKELFLLIEEKFRKLNSKYGKPLGFDYWFIDRDGNLRCFTREVELFVFLCDKENYPDKLINTTIYSNPPKRLPPQCSTILKYVPKDIDIDYIKTEISSKFQSIFNVEEMRGTIGAKSRHIRIDLSIHDEYMRMLNGGVIAIAGQLIEVTEFLAPPRLLICSRCNTPGHIKKECKNEFDLCRRCGQNRSQGEHKECFIKCHHCEGNHESTSYQCPLIVDFRRELINKLKNKPNLLPRNVQLFIPTEYRSKGKNNRILTNNTTDAYSQRLQQQQQTLSSQSNEWPYLYNNANKPPPKATWFSSSSPLNNNNNNNIWNAMNKTQSDFDLLKAKFEKQEADLNKKYNEHKFKLGSILSLISVQIQQQNEGLKSITTTLNKIVPIISLSLEICHGIFTKEAANTVNQHEKLLPETISQQIQTSISFLDEQNQLISNKHLQLLENFEDNKLLLQRGMELFMSKNE